MTTEQIALIKKLIDKHGIKGTDGEWSLIFLGVGYDLTEKQIESYLSMETSDLMNKHEKMICLLFGIEEDESKISPKENPSERLRLLFESHYGKMNLEKQTDTDYGNVMTYILGDNNLSAAQIEQLRQAVEVGMPEKDVLEMAKNRKNVMEIRRCVEFYQMMKQRNESSPEQMKVRRKNR
jgi:hypothetical protein